MAAKPKNATPEGAAAARGDYLRALEVELVGYERHDRADRVKDVKAEIARVKKSAPTGSTAPDDSSTA